ncbi:MAG: ATP-binding cassette domain-containing protein [Bacilli bacterium]|nr:ATP-binding cassette domain-containing protein [Bacilli bacterium]
MADKILSVKDLVINFKTDNGLVQAVRKVSFDLERGETLCIVGESGSGKSVTSKAIMGILANNAIVEGGSIMYNGENLLEVSEEEFHKIRGHKIGMIFQDPLSSLNPIVRIGKQITEATLINSDKLKLMYNDLISKELIAYKNTLARSRVQITNEQNKLNRLIKEADKIVSEKEKKIAELTSKLVNAQDENETNEIKAEIQQVNADAVNRLQANKEEVKAAKVQCKANIKKIKAEANEQAKPLKVALVAKQKEAKQKVSEYKASVLAEKNARIAEINQRLSNCTTDEEKKALKAEIEQVKLDTVNKLKITKAEAKRRALEIMREVGIPQPEKRFRQYPFEFSGGMRQRIVIAIALTEAPEILICDEPTTALDVTIQAQILELIKKIQAERNISCIFITHDLGVVANMADRVAVMYAGKIVEYGKVDEIFFEPKHPYTWALLSSIPDVDSKERLETIPGTPPNMIYPPKGDAFALRSKYAMKIDFEEEPPYFKISDSHYAATWLLHPMAPKVEMPKIVAQRIKNALSGAEELEKGGTSNEQ